MRLTRPHLLAPFVGLLALTGVFASISGLSTVEQQASMTTTTTLSVPILPSPKLGTVEPTVAAEGDDGVVAATSPTMARIAGPIINAGWNAAVPLKNSAGATTNCGSTWSGGSDAAGLVYHACNHAIHVRGPKGGLRDVIATGETAPVGRRDVAPNAAGTIVYYTVGERQDTDLSATQLKAGWGTVHRMKLVSGVWKRDTTYSVGPVLLDGNPWSLRYLTVGADGILYASVNQFVYAWDQQGRPRADQYGQYKADGTRIGDPIAGWAAQGPAPGFNVVEGLAMSADGNYLFANEEDYDFLTRFSRNASGAWIADKIAGVPKSTVDSCDPPYLKAPYDVGVTTAGTVIVTNTTCSEIRMYDLNLQPKGSVIKNLGTLPHGVAVAGNGALILPWRNEIYTRR
jgi:hypothetical protein